MHSRWLKPCTRAAGLVLIGLAAAHLAGNQGHLLIQPAEPVFQVSTRYLFWGLGACELAVGLACLLGSDLMLANGLVLWLTSSLLVYRLGLLDSGVATLRAYYLTMAHAFGVSAGTLNIWFGSAIGGLWCGSGLGVALLWQERRELRHSLKMSCPSCGVHISFATQNLGQQTSCPHCQARVTLRKAESLKMSCFFCHEHIEFPAHALGQKIHCPHCKMDITLKEPA